MANEAEKVRKRNLAFGLDDEDDGGVDPGEEDDDDDSLPFAVSFAGNLLLMLL